MKTKTRTTKAPTRTESGKATSGKRAASANATGGTASGKVETETVPRMMGRTLINENPVIDSMEAAAALTGYSIELLKLAKAGACPAFKNTRVDVFALDEWLAGHPEIAEEENRQLTLAQAEVRERVAKALDRQLAYRKRRRELIPSDEMRRSFARAFVALKTRLLAIPSSLAADLAVETDAVEIETDIRKAITDSLDELQKGSEFAQVTCMKCGEKM
jgi:hypothetical protein